MIGAGFSGLAVARALRERDQHFVCLDRTNGPGGLWRHTVGDDRPTAAYRSLHLNTARDVTGFRGFPMPAHFPLFPSHQQVSEYLSSFADHIGLSRDAEFDTRVVSVSEADDSGWNVVSRNVSTGEQQSRYFRNVVVATGHHNEPETGEPFPGEETFTGELIHSVDYTDATRFAGKNVLVIGIGNSACDISVELSRVTAHTFIAMRRGAHVVPKQLLGMPIDAIAASRWWARMPFRLQRRFVEFLLHVARGPITRYGIPEPDHRIFSAPVTISDDLLSRISHGYITAKPAVARIDGDWVHFTDGTRVRVDAIVRCTGYRVSFPFLKPRHAFQVNGQVALYRRVVARTRPGLYFTGLIRPFGSSTRPIEAQAEWVADLIAGKAVLPSWTEMTTEIDEYLAGVVARLGTSQVNSIQVDVGTYLRSLRQERADGARRAQARPEPKLEPNAFAGLCG